MSNEHAEMERKESARALTLYRVCNGGLESAVGRAGGELTGFSVKLSLYDCLVTIKAVFPAGPMVCFVGGESLQGCLLKAHREAGQDKLRWKADKWGKK